MGTLGKGEEKGATRRRNRIRRWGPDRYCGPDGCAGRARNRRGAGNFGGIGHHPEVARRRQTALPGVQHIQPRQHRVDVGVRRLPLHPAADLLVHAELGALPAVQIHLVGRGHVVEHYEHPRIRVFDDGGQRAFPADVLAAEGQPPTRQPASSGHRGVRRTLEHLLGMHVRAVRGVERHGESLNASRPGGVSRHVKRVWSPRFALRTASSPSGV